METVIHAETQSEDETTVNDRATADHVCGCRIAHGCTHLISSWNTVRSRCRCRACRTVGNSTLNLMASCWLLVSFSCAWHLHRLIIGPIWLCWFHSHSSLVIELPDLNRGWLVSILVGLSITAVDTYVVQYGVWPYVTHAFRQSADSSGLCPIQLAWSRHRFVVLCRGAYAHWVG